MEQDKALAVWNMVLDTALKIPGVRIDRETWLRSALAPYATSDVLENAIATTPARAGIPASDIERIAESSIKWHRYGVSATSTVAGLPGGWWIAGTIPADLAQYFWHVTVVVQKLAYLYGWPELLQEDSEIDDETKLVITLFVGVMLGAQSAVEGVSRLATALGEQVARRLPSAALTKYAIYRVAKEVARWIGFSLTKKKFAELLGRGVPVIGGAIAGTITWVAFGKGARRLHEHLRDLPLARPARAA